MGSREVVGTLWLSVLPAGFQQERKQSRSWVGRMKAGAPLSAEGRDDRNGGEWGGWGRVHVISGETSSPKLKPKKIKGAI